MSISFPFFQTHSFGVQSRNLANAGFHKKCLEVEATILKSHNIFNSDTFYEVDQIK